VCSLGEKIGGFIYLLWHPAWHQASNAAKYYLVSFVSLTIEVCFHASYGVKRHHQSKLDQNSTSRYANNTGSCVFFRTSSGESRHVSEV
jgi:hypothetical protein